MSFIMTWVIISFGSFALPYSAKLCNSYEQMFLSDSFSEATINAGEELTTAMSEEWQKSWQDLIELTDLTRSSRKAWATITRLSNDHTKMRRHYNVTANRITRQMLLNFEVKQPKPSLNGQEYQKTLVTLTHSP